MNEYGDALGAVANGVNHHPASQMSMPAAHTAARLPLNHEPSLQQGVAHPGRGRARCDRAQHQPLRDERLWQYASFVIRTGGWAAGEIAQVEPC